MSEVFEKTVTFMPAFDKRDPDPSKSYGIGGVTIRFVLRGERGATQFLILTDWYLPHVQKELKGKDQSFNSIQPTGADIGYHAYSPQFEDQRPMAECDVLGCACYYDGTSLGASEFIPTFLAGGCEAVWKMLENEYLERFGS
jgi:hypothetical protein